MLLGWSVVRLIGHSYSVISFSLSDTPMSRTSFAVKLIVSVVAKVKVQVSCHDRLVFGDSVEKLGFWSARKNFSLLWRLVLFLYGRLRALRYKSATNS